MKTKFKYLWNVAGQYLSRFIEGNNFNIKLFKINELV